MNQNLILYNERILFAKMKRVRKANKFAKQIAHGGWGEKAKQNYLDIYPEAKFK